MATQGRSYAAATTNRTPKPRTPLAITSELSTATSNALTADWSPLARPQSHLLGYDAVGVGYGFGDLLKSPPESIPPERVFPFSAGTLPLGGEKAEDKFDNIAIQFAVGMRERLELSGQAVTLADVGDVGFGIQLNLEAEARRQLGQRRFEVNEKTNKLRLQPKNQLKESPDHFDALLIGYFALCMPCAAQVCPGRCTSAGIRANDRGRTHKRKQRNPGRWRLIDERLALLRQTGRGEYIPRDDRDWFWNTFKKMRSWGWRKRKAWHFTILGIGASLWPLGSRT